MSSTDLSTARRPTAVHENFSTFPTPSHIGSSMVRHIILYGTTGEPDFREIYEWVTGGYSVRGFDCSSGLPIITKRSTSKQDRAVASLWIPRSSRALKESDASEPAQVTGSGNLATTPQLSTPSFCDLKIGNCDNEA